MTELELKFHVLPAQRAALLKALGNRKLERVSMVARYLDTADGLLARHHLALRLRQEGARWVQTLKGAGPSGEEREEHNVDLGELTAASPAPTVDPARHRGTPVGDRLLSLLADEGHPELAERLVTDVARVRRRLRVHDADIEWALDEGTIHAQDAVGAISELELEFKGGARRGLYAAALEWQARHGLWLDAVSKAQRGQLLARGQAYRAPAHAAVPDWTRKSAGRLDGPALLRRMVSECLAQVLPNASEIARGSVDPEHIHQLRVGLRRVRSVIREMAPFGDGLADGWEAPVRRVFTALGSSRDLHVFTTGLATTLRAAGAPTVAFAPVPDDAPVDSLGEHVRASDFQSALLHLMAFADDGAASAPAGEAQAPPLDRLRHRLSRLQRRIARDAAHFETLPFDAQHRVRKRLKRLRYVAAFLAPLYPRRDVKAWLKAVKPAQAALGHHIDVSTAAHRFEAAAAVDPRAWFAVGWLRRETAASACASRQALRRLAGAKAFW